MMKKILLILLIGFFACDQLNFTEDGKKIQQEIFLEEFSQLSIEGTAGITLKQNAENKAVLNGFEKEVEVCSLSVDAKILQFENSYGNWTKNFDPLELRLYFTNLNKIICLEPCSIVSKGTIVSDHFVFDVRSEAQIVEADISLNCKSLQMKAIGSINGGFKFGGRCKNADFVLNGSSNILAEDLICDTVSIVQNSVGNCTVHATQFLKVTFYTHGNVYYTGNPEIVVERKQINNQTPTGEIIKLD